MANHINLMGIADKQEYDSHFSLAFCYNLL